MKPLPKIALALSLVLTPVISFATAGKVIDYKTTCGYLLVEGINLPAGTPKHFLLLKQQGNITFIPRKNDVLDGFYLESVGVKPLRNVATTAVLWVYNEDGWLFKDDAVNKYVAKCGAIPKPKPVPKPAANTDPKDKP